MNNELNYWRTGIPMHHAPIHFAPIQMRDEWEALSQVNALEVAQKHMAEAEARNVSGFDLLGSILQGANSVLAPRNKILDAARADLLKRIQARLYLAYGFEAPRTLAATPVHIPSAYWRGTVKWEQSELISESLRFVEIRLIDCADARLIAAAAQEHAAQTPTTSPPPETESLTEPTRPIIGRPTIRPQIFEAFYKLLTSDALTPDMSMKTIAQHVRQQLAHDYPDLPVTNSSPNYETIRRVISPHWGKNTKQ